MPLFCKHKDILGKPHEGVHKARLFRTDNFEGFARNDVVMTLIGALIIVIILSYYKEYDWMEFGKKFGIISTGLFILGFILHLLFCVKTPLTKPFL